MAEPITIICGAYNGRSPAIAAQVTRAQRFINEQALQWDKSQAAFEEWAVETMAGVLRGIANQLIIE